MLNDIDLKEIEKKAWMRTYEDGFIDIIIGVLLIVFAIMPFVDQLIGRWYILIMATLPALFSISLIHFGKKKITAPRIGFAKFGAERKSAQKKSLSLSLLSSVILVTLVLFTAFGLFSKVFGITLSGFKVPFTIAIGVMALMWFKARILQVPRLEIYGVVIGCGVISIEILRDIVGRPWHNVISWGVPGVIILLYGLHLLVTFTRKYPLPIEGSEV